MDVRSLISRFVTRFITNSGLAFCLGAAVLSPASLADINAGTNSEDRFWINRTHDNLAKFDYVRVGVLLVALSNRMYLGVLGMGRVSG